MCVAVGEVYACQGIGVEVRRLFCQCLCHMFMSYVDSWDLKADKSVSVFMCFSGCPGVDKSSWLLKPFKKRQPEYGICTAYSQFSFKIISS